MTDRASTEALREALLQAAKSRMGIRLDAAEVRIALATLRDTGPRPDSGIDEDVLRQMVERPMTSAYFEDFNAGRLDSEQVARALAGDYVRLSTPRTASGPFGTGPYEHVPPTPRTETSECPDFPSGTTLRHHVDGTHSIVAWCESCGYAHTVDDPDCIDARSRTEISEP